LQMPRRRAASPAVVAEVVYGGSDSEDECEQEDPAPSVQQQRHPMVPPVAPLRPPLQQVQPMQQQPQRQPMQQMRIPPQMQAQQPQPARQPLQQRMQTVQQQRQAAAPQQPAAPAPQQQPQPWMQQGPSLQQLQWQLDAAAATAVQLQHQMRDQAQRTTLLALKRLLLQKQDFLLHPPTPLVLQPREREDRTFVVPAASGKRRIVVMVPPFQMVCPVVRPSKNIPIRAQYLANDPFAAKIDFLVCHTDFAYSGKLGGKIKFTPASDWPENTARICVFYYIGTQNTGKWLRSEFATVDIDLNDRNQDGNLKEVSTKFCITLDRSYTAVTDASNGRLIRKEQIGLVAVACAGTTIIRGEESVFNFEYMEAAARELQIQTLTARNAQLQQLQHGAVAAAAPPVPQAPPLRAASAARAAAHPYARPQAVPD
ncbi:hypothetical protein PENTCL1PPCAC_21696, partial [Pristionchus entomophagus]